LATIWRSAAIRPARKSGGEEGRSSAPCETADMVIQVIWNELKSIRTNSEHVNSILRSFSCKAKEFFALQVAATVSSVLLANKA
jgi:hypothetical protein